MDNTQGLTPVDIKIGIRLRKCACGIVYHFLHKNENPRYCPYCIQDSVRRDKYVNKGNYDRKAKNTKKFRQQRKKI